MKKELLKYFKMKFVDMVYGDDDLVKLFMVF